MTTSTQQAVVQQWLQHKGLNFPELFLANGAGLSRKERIDVAFLQHIQLSLLALQQSLDTVSPAA